jgi:hypothetical protein
MPRTGALDRPPPQRRLCLELRDPGERERWLALTETTQGLLMCAAQMLLQARVDFSYLDVESMAGGAQLTTTPRSTDRNAGMPCRGRCKPSYVVARAASDAEVAALYRSSVDLREFHLGRRSSARTPATQHLQPSSACLAVVAALRSAIEGPGPSAVAAATTTHAGSAEGGGASHSSPSLRFQLRFSADDGSRTERWQLQIDRRHACAAMPQWNEEAAPAKLYRDAIVALRTLYTTVHALLPRRTAEAARETGFELTQLPEEEGCVVHCTADDDAKGPTSGPGRRVCTAETPFGLAAVWLLDVHEGDARIPAVLAVVQPAGDKPATAQQALPSPPAPAPAPPSATTRVTFGAVHQVRREHIDEPMISTD